MANKTEFQKYAAQTEATWDSPGFENLPQGEYSAKIDKGEIKQSKSGFWMLALTWKIFDNEDFNGRLLWTNMLFETAKGWNPWAVKNFFNDMGLELPEFEDMEDAIEELSGLAALLEVGDPDEDFQSIDVIEGIESNDSDEEDEEDEEDDSEEESKEESSETDYASEIEDIDDWSKEDCVDAAEDWGIELTGKTVKKMRAEIVAWVNLQGEPQEEESEEDEVDPTTEALYEFCVSSGIEDVEDGMSKEEIIEILEEYDFKEEEMSADEVKLLQDNGLGKIIEMKKKAPARKRRAKK